MIYNHFVVYQKFLEVVSHDFYFVVFQISITVKQLCLNTLNDFK